VERFLDEPGRFGHVVRNHLEQHCAARQHCTQPLRTPAADRTNVSTVVTAKCRVCKSSARKTPGLSLISYALDRPLQGRFFPVAWIRSRRL
jgi:hypothetical protein